MSSSGGVPKRVQALADPAGRQVLIDFVLLRHMAQSEESAGVVAPEPALRSKRLPYLVAAAAVVVALLGGYQLGQLQPTDDSPRPPAATRVVQSERVWQEVVGAR